MPVGIVHWRAGIDVSNARLNVKSLKLKYHRSICFLGSCHLYVMGFLLLLLMISSCDIDLNPAKKKGDSCYNLSLFHWHLNSITTYDFSKLKLLEVYNMKDSFDIICLS